MVVSVVEVVEVLKVRIAASAAEAAIVVVAVVLAVVEGPETIKASSLMRFGKDGPHHLLALREASPA